MIAGGGYASAPNKMTEVVELVKTNSTPFYGQLPSVIQLPFGAMLGNVPILCGGQDFPVSYDSCVTFENSQWRISHSMNEKRTNPAGVQINSTTLWILGGSEYNPGGSHIYHHSTEFISQGQTNGIPGQKLPYALSSMCAVKLSQEEIFLIGGRSGSDITNEVWIFNPQNRFARKQGPSMNTKRRAHSCSTMKDGEKTAIVVAGGYNSTSTASGGLDSVEIYDPTDNNWHLGKEITEKLQ